jgi:hypothetical protein
MTPPDVLSVLVAGARGAAYFGLHNLADRIGAFPEGTRGTYAYDHLRDAQMRVSRLAYSLNEERSILFVERQLEIKRPETREQRRVWLNEIVTKLKGSVHAEDPTSEGHDDVESLAALAFDVGVPAADLIMALKLLHWLRPLREKPAGAATDFIQQETELHQMLATESKEAIVHALDRFASAASGRKRTSPAVLETVAQLRQSLEDPSSLEANLQRLAASISYPPEPAPADLPPPSPEELKLAASVAIFPAVLDHRDRFADLAQRRGDPRGVLVRDQVRLRRERLARGDGASFESDLIKQLIRRHPEWTEGALELGATSARISGGFVEEITISASLFIANYQELYRRFPIRSVIIDPQVDDGPIGPLLRSGAMYRLSSLTLANLKLTAQDVIEIASCGGYFANLVVLDLSSNRIKSEGVLALATETDNSGALRSLTHVNWDGNPCGPLYTMEYTLQEIPTQEWVRTDLGITLGRQYPNCAWLRPWSSPSLDILVEEEPP